MPWGEQNRWFIHTWEDDKLYAEDFAYYVNAIPATAINILLTTCNSGGFVQYFNTQPNVVISTATDQDNSVGIPERYITVPFTNNWINSHTSRNLSIGCFPSALESFNYACNLSPINENPQHYGAGTLSSHLTLLARNYHTYNPDWIDGYCQFAGNSTQHAIQLDPDRPRQETAFGVPAGATIITNITQPTLVHDYFDWTITDGLAYLQNYSTGIGISHNSATFNMRSNNMVGTSVRVKVSVSIPSENLNSQHFLNFFTTDSYYVSSLDPNTLQIARDLDSQAVTRAGGVPDNFTYTLTDSTTGEIALQGEAPTATPLKLSLLMLRSGKYHLKVMESDKLCVSQDVTLGEQE